MKTTLGLLLAVLCGIWLTGCNIINPAEPLPAYIVIPEFQFSTNSSTEYSDSEKITEVWVYVNSQMMGAYELPAEVPVLAEGNVQVDVFAGIKNNGIAGSRIIYPFYAPYSTSVELDPLEKVTVIPEFIYKDNINITLVDDFEEGNVFTIDNSAGSITRITDEVHVFEGDACGFGTVEAGEGVLQFRTNEQQYPLPTNRLSWIEMDYKCNNSFAVGLKAYVNGQLINEEIIIVLFPTDDSGIPEWNKIYIETSQLAASSQSAQYFEIFFQSFVDSGNPASEIWLDNIKLLYF